MRRQLAALSLALAGSASALTPLATPEDLPPFRIAYAVPVDGTVAMAVDDARGRRVRNLIAQVERPAGAAAEAWDLRDGNGDYVAPGTYRVSAVAGPPVELIYRVTPYPNVAQLWPDRTPWLQGHSGPHGWLSDHSQNWAVAAVGDRVYFGAPMAEAGMCLIECDRDGRKRWGKHDFGAWKGVGQMASDGTDLYVAASDDVLYRIRASADNAVTRLGPVSSSPERRGHFSCMAAHGGLVYLGFTGERFTDNAFPASLVDLDRCVPRPAGDSFLRALRLCGSPPGQDADPSDPGPQGNGRLDIESTVGPHRDQHSVIALREPAPLGSVVFPHPGGKTQVRFSVLKPDAPYPPRPTAEQDWTPFSSGGTPGGWNCVAAPPATVTRALRITFSRPDLPAFDPVQDELEKGVIGGPGAKDAWHGRLEGLRLLRRRFENALPSARVRVNSGAIADDGSWDAKRTEALDPEQPGIYVMEWDTPQRLRSLAIKEVDGAVTEVDVWQGPPTGEVPLTGEALDRPGAATGWRHAATYRQKRRSAYTPSADMNKFARYLDGCVEFDGEVETHAVRLRVTEPWLDHGDKGAECRKHDGRSEHGMHYTQSYAAGLDTRRCRIEGVAPLRYLGGEPPLDPKTYQRVAVVDGQTGALLKELPARVGWHGLACGPDGALYAINREHTGIARIDTETGQMTPVVSQIEPSSMTVGPDGLVYVFPWTDGGRREIQVYDRSGRRVRAIGKPGGWGPGPWEPERFGPVHRMCVDGSGSLWVVETDNRPRRILQYEAGTGRLAKEILGNTPYGGGGTLNRYDPSRLWYGRVEFEIDWTRNTSRVRGLLAEDLDGQDVIALRVKGRPESYLVTAPLSLRDRQSHGVVYRYDEAAGTVRRAAAVGSAEFFGPLRASAIISKLGGGVPRDFIFTWSDRNGNGEVDPDEVQFEPRPRSFDGVGRFDYELGCTGAGILFGVKEFLPDGVPVYGRLPVPGRPHLRLTNGNLLTLHSPSVDGGPNENFVCAPSGAKLWGYRAHAGVSGLYIAPWSPGQANHQFSLIGHEVAPAGDLGEFVVIHANTGEWNLWTADGLLACQILLHKAHPRAKPFGPHEAKPGMRLDPLTAGQEHFHGFFTRTEPDNRYFIVAGFTHASVIEVRGLEQYRRFAIEVTVTAADIERAQAWDKARVRRQIATQALVIQAEPRPAVPAPVRLDPTDNATFSVGYDETNLYLTWTGKGLGPLRNSGTEFQRYFKTGAALDFYLGADPDADPARERPQRGDLRLLIAFVAGQPKAVLYQPVAPGAAATQRWQTKTEAGGEVAFDRVVPAPSAEVKMRGDRDFVVEATVPLRVLGLRIRPGLQLKTDWGILTSSDGHQVKQRLYWANKTATGTSDEATEARLEPSLWGTLRFVDEDAAK